MTYPIDKDVPYPGKRFPVDNMDIGDSFEVPWSDIGSSEGANNPEVRAFVASVHAAAMSANIGIDYRESAKGMRFWRTR